MPLFNVCAVAAVATAQNRIADNIFFMIPRINILDYLMKYMD